MLFMGVSIEKAARGVLLASTADINRWSLTAINNRLIILLKMATSLYCPTTQFNGTYFVPNSDVTGLCFAGNSNGSPFLVSTTIPAGNSYKFQVTATFGSGEGEEDTGPVKQETFATKVPIPRKKGLSPSKSPQKVEEKPSIAKDWTDYLYMKPAQSKTEKVKPVKAFEPSGNVVGQYVIRNSPWPTNFNIYVNINYQINVAGTAYEFQLAADPSWVN